MSDTDYRWFQDFKRRTLAEADVCLSMGGVALAFDESKVKRGQPENKGQFGSKGGSSDQDAKPASSADQTATPSESSVKKGAAILKRYGAKLSAAADKVPVVGFVKQKMTQVLAKIHDTAAKRYGPKTAKAIMASGTVMDLALMAGGVALTGVPIVTGVNQLLGIIPAFCLAEAKYQLTGTGAKMGVEDEERKLSQEEFDAACLEVGNEIVRAFAKLLAEAKQHIGE